MRHLILFSIRRGLTLLVLVLACAACTVARMQQENDVTEMRIRSKQWTLAESEATLRVLRAEQSKLLNDLSVREMTAEDLSQRIEALRQLNASTASSNQKLQDRKAELERELAAASKELKAIPPTAGPSRDPTAAKRLEEAKRKVRRTLELLLAS
jgi:predicted RNase H-like nuclease (RuvC/YqgF family)